MVPGNPLQPQLGPTGPASPPTPNPGIMANSLSMVGNAVQMLQKALQDIPIGSEEQKAVIDSIQKLSKIAPPSAQVPGVQANNLRGLEQEATEGAMLSALLRNMQAQGQRPGASPSPAAPPGAGMM